MHQSNKNMHDELKNSNQIEDTTTTCPNIWSEVPRSDPKSEDHMSKNGFPSDSKLRLCNPSLKPLVSSSRTRTSIIWNPSISQTLFYIHIYLKFNHIKIYTCSSRCSKPYLTYYKTYMFAKGSKSTPTTFCSSDPKWNLLVRVTCKTKSLMSNYFAQWVGFPNNYLSPHYASNIKQQGSIILRNMQCKNKAIM